MNPSASPPARRVDVLVVGAGPAGLAAATTLGGYGLDVLVVERRPEPSSLPRATAVGTRVAELFRGWGLSGALAVEAVDADVWLWEASTLATARDGQGHAVGYPTREQAALVSPVAPVVVAQDAVERVLRAGLAARRTVRVELGAEVLGIDRGPHQVAAEVRFPGGHVTAVVARYVVAADGAHGAIRRDLDIGMVEHGDGYAGVQAVLRAPLWERVGAMPYALFSVTTAEAPGLFLPAGGDRWVYGPGLPMDDPAHPGEDREALAAWVRRGAGFPDLPVAIERVGAFDSRAAMADTFRAGRVLLAGDAAHRVTPRGGTGMNSALLGGHDLGWKLAWVLLGWASDALLDTYEAERRPVVDHHLARSLDPSGSRRPVADELAIDLGGRVAHAWVDAPAGRRSTLDLLGPGWTLLTGEHATSWAAHASRVTAPVAVRSLPPMAARSIGIPRGGALLVRPDGVPTAAWDRTVHAGELVRATVRLAGEVREGRAA